MRRPAPWEASRTFELPMAFAAIEGAGYVPVRLPLAAPLGAAVPAVAADGTWAGLRRMQLASHAQPVTAQVPQEYVRPAAAGSSDSVVPYVFVCDGPQVLVKGSHVYLAAMFVFAFV